MAKKRPGRPVKAGGGGEIVRANIDREVVASPTFVTLYTNDTQVQVTPWDVRLIFGEISSGPTDKLPTIEIKQTGEVRMSPQHAKRIMMILLQQLTNYEERFGAIPQPPD